MKFSELVFLVGSLSNPILAVLASLTLNLPETSCDTGPMASWRERERGGGGAGGAGAGGGAGGAGGAGGGAGAVAGGGTGGGALGGRGECAGCLLYTSDAADDC